MMLIEAYEFGIKTQLRLLPGGDDLRHVVYGLGLYLLFCLLPRQAVGTRLPLMLLFLAELANEAADRLHYGSWRPADTIGDIINTMLLPLLLAGVVVIARAAARDATIGDAGSAERRQSHLA